MSINWNWKDKIGTATDRNGNTVNIYRGNCFMIGIYEYKDKEGNDLYNLAWFFADENHMKNSFGLNKGYEKETIDKYNFESFSLNTEYKEVWKFAKAVAQAKPKEPITIKFYTEPKEY